MDDFHDDHAHHNDKGDEAGRSGHSASGTEPSISSPNGQVPSMVFRIQGQSRPEPEDWMNRFLNELPEGYAFDASRNRVVEEATGKLVCAPLLISALIKAPSGGDWHALIEFRDHDGQMQELVICSGDFEKSFREVTKRLAKDGFAIASSVAFSRYIRAQRARDRGFVLSQSGYADLGNGTSVFVERNGNILHAASAELPVVRAVGCHGKCPEAGSLAAWQREVARPAIGNPAIIFALSTALTAPLLACAKAEPIGVNFFGTTSSGKSTLLRVMASVDRDPAHLTSWNATETAIELMARYARDGLLILDEFPSHPDRWHIKALMSLGNGTGKARGNLTRDLEQGHSTRTVTASSAESSTRRFLRDAGFTPPDGMSVRMIDIPVRRWSHGVFETLHHHPDGRSFSAALTDAAVRSHGHAGPAFICWIMQHETKLRTKIGLLVKTFFDRITAGLGLSEIPGDVGRVLNAFSLISVAGELAILAGILPWKPGTAEQAVILMARIWFADRNGEVSDRTRGIAARIHAARDTFADFENAVGARETDTGWRTADWYHVLPAAFERFAGEHPQSAARDLEADGILRRGSEANCLLSRISVPGLRERKRVYSLRRTAILDALGLSED